MNYATPEQLTAFESRIRDLFAEGELPFLIHLGGGNEETLSGIFAAINDGDWILASHRNHFHALLAGIAPDRLEDLIRRGKSMFVYSAKKRFLTSAILGGACGIAAGLALAVQLRGGAEKVWCFLGDGASDNGHLYEAALFVESRGLPCMFLIEDNNRSVDATKEERRGPRETPPLDTLFRCVQTYCYTPTYPHGGAGLSRMIAFKPAAIERYLKG